MRFERRHLTFKPGQYLHVGPAHDRETREYSIYSPTDSDALEILVKEVTDGKISRKLQGIRPGQSLHVAGPFGFFLMPEEAQAGCRQVVLIATGTGISPMRCFVESYPRLDYTLIHGIRSLRDQGEYRYFDPSRVRCCVSRERPLHLPFFSGRVTDYLRSMSPDPDALYFLCGNCNMIYEAHDHLRQCGVSTNSIKAEVYF